MRGGGRCALALLCALASTAWAQDLAALPPDSAIAIHAARLPSPTTSAWVSTGFTVGPIILASVLRANSGSVGYQSPTSARVARAGAGLALAGLVLGPATGYWYGGVGGKAWPGLLLRAGGFALFELGATNSLSANGEWAALGIGSALLLGSAIYDVATVSHKVRAHNTAMTRAMIVPLFSPSERRAGVAIVVGF